MSLELDTLLEKSRNDRAEMSIKDALRVFEILNKAPPTQRRAIQALLKQLDGVGDVTVELTDIEHKGVIRVTARFEPSKSFDNLLAAITWTYLTVYVGTRGKIVDYHGTKREPKTQKERRTYGAYAWRYFVDDVRSTYNTLVKGEPGWAMKRFIKAIVEIATSELEAENV